MSFVEFCVGKGYKPFRKVFNTSLKRWEYIECPVSDYCSSCSPGYLDIRLMRGDHEIVWGIPGVFKVKDGNEFKTHFPTLLYPNPFGSIYDVDRVFGSLSFDKILCEVEKLTQKRQQ